MALCSSIFRSLIQKDSTIKDLFCPINTDSLLKLEKEPLNFNSGMLMVLIIHLPYYFFQLADFQTFPERPKYYSKVDNEGSNLTKK